MMNKWNYGGYAEKYDMSGVIKVGTGEVMVHDIFGLLPEFMRKAEVIFCDPPCSQGNLQSFYTKADKELQNFFKDFQKRLFECIDEIQPKQVFIELFKSNRDAFIAELLQRFEHVDISASTYYHKASNVCWIAHGYNEPGKALDLHGLDEQDAIEKICANGTECIGDLCMGRGLVGFYANKAGRQFVGTELNENRLAVLLHRIDTGKL